MDASRADPRVSILGVAAVSTLGVAALAWRLGAVPTLVAGYAKLSRRLVETHPTREAVLQMLRAEPGLHIEILHRRLDVPLSTLRHHLRVLERHGLVALSRTGGRTYAVPAERQERDFGLRCRALESETSRAILRLIRREPGLDQTHLAAQAGKARSTVRWHLRSLQAAGLVETRRDGASARYFAPRSQGQ